MSEKDDIIAGEEPEYEKKTVLFLLEKVEVLVTLGRGMEYCCRRMPLWHK
jgi:DNA-directed RNA polymerase subunit N (RpoN/RPB10)